MAIGPLVPMVPFSPIDSVTPFTYRDNDTYLTVLESLTRQINLVSAYAADLQTTVSDAYVAGDTTLAEQFNKALADIQKQCMDLLSSLKDEGIAYDPTNGTHSESYSTVLGRVYDYTRIYAIFAVQYDNLGLTAAQYDALNMTARHFDLAATYPVLNDVVSTTITSIQ